MNIEIKTIPHKKQRYDTVGDWFSKNGTLHIRVSDMGNELYEYLVASHELREAFLCIQRGITEKDVDEFDIQFEQERKAGLHGLDEEPGDHSDAPYRKEHFYATTIERLDAAELGVDWNDYDRAVMNL